MPRFDRPEFGGRHEFHGGESNFSFWQESSFGGGGSSFFPDLLGLALAIGGFGARGFGLPGFGLPGLALNLLEAGLGSINSYGGGSGGDFGYAGYGFEGGYPGPAVYSDCVGSIWTPCAISPYWGPAMITYPAPILAFPQ